MASDSAAKIARYDVFKDAKPFFGVPILDKRDNVPTLCALSMRYVLVGRMNYHACLTLPPLLKAGLDSYLHHVTDAPKVMKCSFCSKFYTDTDRFDAHEVFLPLGYPDSVSSDYLAYQLWDTLQAFCSSITGTLATMAVLQGVGVGDSAATPLAATITWMLKDGTGMIGRISFAWLYGTDLDCNAKRWRLAADVFNDLAIFLELLAPFFPGFFLLIVCSATLSRAIVGTAGGATRAALVQHQARRDNMADVAAKDGSQETLVNLCALLVNLALTPAVAGHTVLIWLLFIVFTALHLFANYRAVSVVCMETLNQARLHIAVHHYLSHGAIPSVAVVNSQEPIVLHTKKALPYSVGSTLSSVLLSVKDYEKAVKDFQRGCKFIIKIHAHNRKVAIALHKDATAGDQLKAACIVEVMDFILQYGPPSSLQFPGSLRDLRGVALSDGGDALLKAACEFAENNYSTMRRDLGLAGWTTSHLLLGPAEWRYNWN